MIGIEEIRAVAERIRPFAHRTPVLTSAYFNARTGREVFFKCENFQKVGAFKFRGACNAVMSLADEEARRGVITHSSGNHAQALALAARLRGVAATIVMPHNAPEVKRNAVRDYGAAIVPCEPTVTSREQTVARLVEESGAVLIHPYNDWRIIAGQGTAALELLEDVPDLNLILVPVGGGGLASGTALAAAGQTPRRTAVVAAEPKNADDAYRSLKAGAIQPLDHANTIADGLRTTLGELTFDVLRRQLREIVTVSEAAIIDAMRLTWERMKILIEPSAAVPLAALLESAADLPFRRVGVILSGGNVDLGKLPW